MSTPLGFNPVGDHAPGLPGHTGPLPGHAPTPWPQFDEAAAAPIAAGVPISGGVPGAGTGDFSPAAALLLLRAAAFVGLLFVSLPWAMLYPLPAAVGVAVFAVLHPALGEPAIALALASLWPASRADQFLARLPAYWYLRHVLRLALFGIAGYVTARDIPAAGIAVALGCAVAGHFALVKARHVQAFWHSFLELIWMRARSGQALAR